VSWLRVITTRRVREGWLQLLSARANVSAERAQVHVLATLDRGLLLAADRLDE